MIRPSRRLPPTRSTCDTRWPQAALAAQAAATWDALSHCPLDVVAGNYWLAGLVAVPSTAQPSVLITGDARFSPWVTPARLLQGGALEESNVDLTGELVNMIVAQRAYQANAQTIKTEDQVLQTLVNLR